MALFTSYVRCVAPVRIYARRDGTRQFMVYEVAYASDGATGLIIPVPTALGDKAHALRFISLQRYHDFFKDLDRAFPRTSRAPGAKVPAQLLEYTAPLEVLYLPTPADFTLLNNRYRLPPDIWNQLPQYRDCSFVLAKLPDTMDTVKGVYPIAFEFKTRLQDDLVYYPTLQVKEYALRNNVVYDHELFYQGPKRLVSDYQSNDSLDSSVDRARTGPLLADGLGYKRHLSGRYPNGDVAI